MLPNPNPIAYSHSPKLVPMEIFKTHKACTILSLLLIFLSFYLLPCYALSPAGTIERTTKQELLASIPPTSGSSQLFLTSLTGKYAAFLLRRKTSIGAGGFGNDFCYIQVQEAGHSVWESECASVSNVNTCTLVFSDSGLEIFDGSRSAWDTDADGDQLQKLELLDAGDMQIRGEDGELAWKASDNPVVNQNCGSIGAPGLASTSLPPFATPIFQGNPPFGQSLDNNGQQSFSGINQQQQELNYPQQSLNQPFSGINQPFSSLNNQPFGANNQQGLVDNTPFDSGVSEEKTFNLGVALVSLITLMAAYGFLV